MIKEIKTLYRAFLIENKELRLSRSHRFKKGWYNYNISALEYVEGSTIPVGKIEYHAVGEPMCENNNYGGYAVINGMWRKANSSR